MAKCLWERRLGSPNTDCCPELRSLILLETLCHLETLCYLDTRCHPERSEVPYICRRRNRPCREFSRPARYVRRRVRKLLEGPVPQRQSMGSFDFADRESFCCAQDDKDFNRATFSNDSCARKSWPNSLDLASNLQGGP